MMKNLHMIAMVLVWIGAINWGLIGLFQFNAVTAIGLSDGMTELIYVIIGLSALFTFSTHMHDCKQCVVPGKGMKKK